MFMRDWTASVSEPISMKQNNTSILYLFVGRTLLFFPLISFVSRQSKKYIAIIMQLTLVCQLSNCYLSLLDNNSISEYHTSPDPNDQDTNTT
jgi:hypothetical protein